MYKLTCQYDFEESPHWSATYEMEYAAWENFFLFKDWGLANEYSTVNLYTPTGKCYTKVFYRDGRVVVK